MSKPKTIEHIFRHEYGKLVALLINRVGILHLESVEDSVQWAIAQALEHWKKNSIPNSPSAWLYRVASNHLLSELKSSQRKSLLLNEHFSVEEEICEQDHIHFDSEISDSLLLMFFAACNDAIPIESQLVFTLKSLCGFNIKEISLRLFISEENAYKRFSRAKKYLKSHTDELDNLTDEAIINRLPSIQKVLYLLFTEGYLSSHKDIAIRQDLCEEAVRLVRLLLETKLGNAPASNALLSLMYFHLAKIATREDEYGALLLLEQQNRDLWDGQKMKLAFEFLSKSANGDEISRYHIEAGIAAEHCLSPSFSQTRWDKIVDSYKLLESISFSPLHRLSRAIAMAEWKGPAAGLDLLKLDDISSWLKHSYHWYTVQADLYFRNGDILLAKKNADRAIETAPTEKIKQLLIKRLIERN